MPVYILSLFEQSERLADDLFEIAVKASDYPNDSNFDRVCGVLEKALERAYRRKVKAGLVFLG